MKIALTMHNPEEIEGLPYIDSNGVMRLARPKWWGQEIEFTEYELANTDLKLTIARFLDLYPAKIVIK
jgi:hypothetical protein